MAIESIKGTAALLFAFADGPSRARCLGNSINVYKRESVEVIESDQWIVEIAGNLTFVKIVLFLSSVFTHNFKGKKSDS